MKNEVLLIPDKTDIERDSIANTWINNGGEVKRIGKFWEKPSLDSRRITIYGIDTFSLVLAQVIGISLIEPKDEVISDIHVKWIKREIHILGITNVDASIFPTFIKPVKPKTFTSKIYHNLQEFLLETNGIDPKDEIIQSDIIHIDAEVRAFIFNHQILDIAMYEGHADIAFAKAFLEDFLENYTIDLPKTYVIDIGYNNKDKWFIIEFNSSWGAGLNGCDAHKVVSGIREATIN